VSYGLPVSTYVLIGAVNAFHIFGVLLALWALAVTALGVLREDFPRTDRLAWLAGATSVLLAAATITSAIITGALEDHEGGEPEAEAAPAPAGGETRLAADPTGQLKFDESALEAQAGTVTIAMTNDSAVPHNVAIEGGGVAEQGKIVKDGGTSTVKARLTPGSYTFYCSVDGHRQAGMQGTLTVR
jgi:plastocyanin